MLPLNQDDLTRALAGAVVLSLLLVVLIGLTTSATNEPHTEFYVLNETDSASSYPTNLSVDETGVVEVGLSNYEGETVTYTIVLQFDDERIASRTVTVQPGESWQHEFSVTPRNSGRQRLDIVLYKEDTAGGLNDADQRLYLWIDVANESARSAG